MSQLIDLLSLAVYLLVGFTLIDLLFGAVHKTSLMECIKNNVIVIAILYGIMFVGYSLYEAAIWITKLI